MIPLAVLTAVGAGLAGALAMVWRASTQALYPPRSARRHLLDAYRTLQAEEVVVERHEGVALAGRFFSGRERATIVLLHGYSGSQDEMLPVAAALNGGGFGVFTYDARGCGRSGGAVTFGALESEDLIAVVDHLIRRADVDPMRIGVLGFSMGAATAILATARDPRIAAVVADSAWCDVRSWLRPSFRSFLVRPRDRFSPPSLKLAELRKRIDLDRLKPVEVVGRLSPRPLLLLHGSADTVVLPEDSEQLLAAAAEPKSRILAPGARHGDTIEPGGLTCGAAVLGFFESALRAPEVLAV
jgi:uncharacterized protein